MAYCTIEQLEKAHGETKIRNWSRLDANTVQQAIDDAGTEIDGYLLSGGYSVPMEPAPRILQKYCIDLAAENLLVGIGAHTDDKGDQAVLEKAKAARRYLDKVATGKFKIPGYGEDDETSVPERGAIRVSSMNKLDLTGY